MDEHLETSWCPVCDRLIEPEKYLVELDDQNRQINILSRPTFMGRGQQQQQQQQPQQAGVGSPAVTRNSRQPVAPGLVRGTGRLQPNGTLLLRDEQQQQRTRSDSDLPVPPVPPPSPVLHRNQRASSSSSSSSSARRTRTVVSQQQTPLYCSAACRARDADSLGIRRLSLGLGPHRRESDSTVSSGSARSVFDKAATSATSLESYDLPPRDTASPPTKKGLTAAAAHTLTWTNGTTGMGATPPRRDNNVRAPSPDPLPFLAPRPTAAPFSGGRRRASAASVHTPVAASASASADEVADRVARTREFFDQHMPFVRVRNDQARQAHLDRIHSAASLASSSSSSSSSSRSSSRSGSHKKSSSKAAKSTSAPSLPTLHETSPCPSPPPPTPPARRFRAPVILPRPGLSLSGHESPELVAKWRHAWAEPSRTLIVWTGTHYATASPDADPSPPADYTLQTYASGLDIYDARGYRRFLSFDLTDPSAVQSKLREQGPDDLADLTRPSNAEPALATTRGRRIAHVDQEDRARERWVLRRMPRRDRALVGGGMPRLRNWRGQEVDEAEPEDAKLREMLLEQYKVLRVEALCQQRARELRKREARASMPPPALAA